MSGGVIMSVLVVAGVAVQGAAYEKSTHANLSRRAFNRSVLSGSDSPALRYLGLREVAAGGALPGPAGVAAAVDHIAEGSEAEDNIFEVPPRPVQHFFDPYNDRSVCPPIVPLSCYTSPQWALEPFVDILFQGSSLRHAREFLRDGLPVAATPVSRWMPPRSVWDPTSSQAIHEPTTLGLRADSRRRRPVQTPILNRLREMRRRHARLAREVRDRARHPQDARVRPRREPEPRGRHVEQAPPRLADVAVASQLGAAQVRIEPCRIAVARALAFAAPRRPARGCIRTPHRARRPP